MLALTLALVSGCALEQKPTEGVPTRAPGRTTGTPSLPTISPTSASVTPTPQLTRTPPPTPSPQPGSQVIVLTPRPSEVGWWATGDTRATHLGDSYLYAGYYEQQVFVSAMRFDLRQIPRGAPLLRASLQLAGVRDDRLTITDGAVWSVQFLDADAPDDLGQLDFQTLFNAPPAVTFFPMLTAASLHKGQTNTISLDRSAGEWLASQVVSGTLGLVVRITGPAGGADSIFAWDSGSGSASTGQPPQLILQLGPPPATQPPLPTQPMLVATLTPTPANLLTVAAYAINATVVAQTGTPTRLPYQLVTPTALMGPPIVAPTDTPANEATAVAAAAHATAVAVTTGTFTPVPTNAMTPILIMPTPMPENVMTAAVQMAASTAQASQIGTPTLLPYGAIVATSTPGPIVITSTPRPLNAATASLHIAYATAVAVTTGTFTPLPRYAVTPTPEPPVPLVQYLDQLPITPRPPTPVPASSVPAQLVGKVLFWSDRDDTVRLMMFDPASGRLAYITQEWVYHAAQAAEVTSPDGSYGLRVQERVDLEDRSLGVHLHDEVYDTLRLLVNAGGISYDPVWSPQGNRIAFVSTEAGNDEIYAINSDGSDMRRLTTNTWEWDKHPSWSPDGSMILFWSNRETGRRQIWVMNADGSNPHRLVASDYDEWDPIWVK